MSIFKAALQIPKDDNKDDSVSKSHSDEVIPVPQDADSVDMPLPQDCDSVVSEGARDIDAEQEDEVLLSIERHKCAYQTAQMDRFCDYRYHIDSLPQELLSDHLDAILPFLSNYARPPFRLNFSGPPIYTIAKHTGIDDDMQLRDLYESFGDLFQVDNNFFTKRALNREFILNDCDLQDELRGMRDNGCIVSYFDRYNELTMSRFMNLNDLNLGDDANNNELIRMKETLDSLTGRDIIEDIWASSIIFGEKEKDQYRLCYNYLLRMLLFVGQFCERGI